MTYSTFRVKVPGKLLIAGDYAVLEPNQQAVVMAIDKFINVTIEPSEYNTLTIPQLGLSQVSWKIKDHAVHFSVSDSRLSFIENSISVATQFLDEKLVDIKPIHLKISSELDDPVSGKKYGFGSSAAIVVAVISAILTMHKVGEELPTMDQVFKLSAIAHLQTQKNGSGADIAASTYGGWIAYTAFRSEWVLNELCLGRKVSELAEKPWPNLSITPIKPPSNLEICVGWTGQPATTGPMVNTVQKWMKMNPKAYTQFLMESSKAVTRLTKSFKLNDSLGAVASLSQNRLALMKLSIHAEISIETQKLKALADLAEKFGSGKSSGAGGGDCGIAFLMGKDQKEDLFKEWQAAGVVPLNVGVSEIGAIVTEYNCEKSLKELSYLF